MHTPRRYRYYDLLLAAFVVALLCSNLIGAGKAAVLTLPVLGEVTFGAGILFFPISYLFGDILTEVYGYAHDRRAVWAGFTALLFAAVMSLVVIQLPPASGDYMDGYQKGLETVFGNTWRIVLASIIALGRQFGECLCHGQDEDHDRRPPSVDANHRLDRRGGTDRLQHFLYDGVLWHLVNRASDRCRDRAVFSENWLGSRHDPGNLPSGRLAEEKRRRGLLRRWH